MRRISSGAGLRYDRLPASLMAVISVVSFFASSQVAFASAGQPDQEKWLSLCGDISSVGAAVMEARQQGVSRDAAMKAAEGNRIIEGLIETAYRAEIDPREENPQRDVREFERGLYQQCVRGAPFKQDP